MVRVDDLVRAQNSPLNRCAGAWTHGLAGIEGLKTWLSDLCYPMGNNGTEKTTLEARCAVHSEAVVKIRQTAWCDRCRAAASRILASLGLGAKLLERGPTTMNCRSPPCDRAK